jgi:hypothetical protein
MPLVLPDDLATHPKVLALQLELQAPDARLLLLDLWSWGNRWGLSVSHPHAVAIIEAAARWQGPAGRAHAALVAAGWVRVDGDAHTILLPLEDAPAARSVTPAPAPVTPAEGTRLTGADARRERNRRYRERLAETPKAAGETVRKTPETPETVGVSQASHGVSEASQSVSEASRVAVGGKGGSSLLFSKDTLKNNPPTPQTRSVSRKTPRDAQASHQKTPRETPQDACRLAASQWLEAAARLQGMPPGEAKWVQSTFIVFRRQLAARGIDTLLRSLEGLRGDTFAAGCGLRVLLSDSLVEKGLTRAAQGAAGKSTAPAPRHAAPRVNEVWDLIEAA